MSSLTGTFNPVLNRRSVIAGAAGLGAASILAGCSDGGNAADAGSAAGSAAATTSGATFKIGAIGPLTGDAASYGTSVVNGTKLAAKDFSDDTYAFEAKGEDDVADGEKSVNAFNTLADWGMQVLVGPTTTGAAVAVAPEAEDAEIFMITPSASSTDVTADRTGVYQVCFTDPNQGVNAAKFLAEKYPDEQVAVFFQADDAYSSGIAEAFKKQAEESKLQLVGDDLTFKKDTQTDFSVQLNQAKEAGATLVFAPIYYTPASVLLTQASSMGYEFTLFGCDGMDGLLTAVEGFDTTLAEGVLLMTPFAADDEKNADFVAAYQDEYGEVPDQFAADAYDAVHAIHEALTAAGVAADADPAEVREALLEQFATLKIEGLTGNLSWNDKGEVQKDPTAYKIEGGKYVQA